MSRIVKCDVCGKIYNQSYLGSHKRLAHGQNGKMALSNKRETKALERILSAYEKLPDSAQKEVRDRLAKQNNKEGYSLAPEHDTRDIDLG